MKRTRTLIATAAAESDPPRSTPPDWARPVRQDAAARRIIAAWRLLTTRAGSRRAGAGAGTLVACSGGADSSALTLALGAAVAGAKGAGGRIVVAHVIHDLRPRREAEADRDAARKLAAMIGAEFVEARVQVSDLRENLEGAARTARYAALLRLAKGEGLRFVATAHHADDQLETVLMALMRGAGPRGLRGVAVSRTMESAPGGVRLVRPMVEAGVARLECERLCRAAGWEWVVDATNADVGRLRSAVRHRVVPLLKELRPSVVNRACATARIMADADRLIRSRAVSAWASATSHAPGRSEWERERLRGHLSAVLGELLRYSGEQMLGTGADRLGARAISPIVRAIRDDSTEPRRFIVGELRVDVTARAVTISARSKR